MRNPCEHFFERRLGVRLAVQPQIRFARFGIRPVAMKAISGEDGAHFTIEGHGLGGPPSKRGDQGNQQ